MSEDFYGLRTHSIGNKFLRLDFLTDAGPRIVRLMLGESNENWMAELPNNVVETQFVRESVPVRRVQLELY